jgi:streptogramin lyase
MSGHDRKHQVHQKVNNGTPSSGLAVLAGKLPQLVASTRRACLDWFIGQVPPDVPREAVGRLVATPLDLDSVHPLSMGTEMVIGSLGDHLFQHIGFSFNNGAYLSLHITVGSDGNLWYTGANVIGRITTAGVVTEFSLLPEGADIAAKTSVDVTLGPDGNIWFTEVLQDFSSQEPAGKIARITPDGHITEYTLPSPGSQPLGIVTGADGNLWFTEAGAVHKIGRITVSGDITEFTLPDADGSPSAIASGADGNLWFTTSNNLIGRITPNGDVTAFAIPSGSFASDITAGPDGNLYFTETVVNKIGRISTDGSEPARRHHHRTGWQYLVYRAVQQFQYAAVCRWLPVYRHHQGPGPSLQAAHDGTASRYTRSRRPTRLVYQESQANRSLALKREAAIKVMSRREKKVLIRVDRSRRASGQVKEFGYRDFVDDTRRAVFKGEHG